MTICLAGESEHASAQLLVHREHVGVSVSCDSCHVAESVLGFLYILENVFFGRLHLFFLVVLLLKNVSFFWRCVKS